MELHSTGRLAVGKGAVEIAVHLLNGDILAATTPDDDRQIVRILHLLGSLTDQQAEDLESRAEVGNDVLGELFSMDLGPHLDEVLQERFVQNMCDFVTSTSTPRFTEQKGVFVANLQMGHDTPALIDEVCRLSDLAKAIDPEALIVRGRADPGTESARVTIADCLSQDPRTVSSLLHEVAVEPTRARVVLSEMLLDGVAAPYLADGTDEGSLDDEETVAAESWPRRPVAISKPPLPPPSEVAAAMDADAISLDVDDLLPSVEPEELEPEELGPEDLEPEDLEPAPPHMPDALVPEDAEADVSEDTPSELLPTASFVSADPPVVEDDEFFPEVDPEDLAEEDFPEADAEPLPDAVPDPDGEPTPQTRAPEPAPGGDSEGVPRSLSDWMADSAVVGEEELDFFGDHDSDRGGDGDGRFKTASHNLDKVEVAAMDDDEDLAIEADEAPAARFGAPTITEEEAEAKIEVANEVLGEVLRAFDAAEGSGRGRAVLQLLVDGVPSQYSALLHDLRISDDGALPYRILLRNLSSRPTTEHRLLLTNGLLDIIERALSSAADELPDDQIDTLLEAVAGYRSRLGL
ncbi:MAG: hypothetical protein H6738_11600 [Alphaproteobacteria bacterium]|nr:hypothetical protein [Alphaproteobacteria bacterium]MCB9697416.1 hypothetical protein [Alphaproteobacteria bacterium]